jgi:cytochrome c oxidase subunit 4
MSESHAEPTDKLYLTIAGALGVLTVISYVADLADLPRTALVFVVLAVAVVKATLVATYFMHLKFDWGNVKVMIIPALILSAVLVFALMPDMTFAQRDAVKRPAAAATEHAKPAH